MHAGAGTVQLQQTPAGTRLTCVTEESLVATRLHCLRMSAGSAWKPGSDEAMDQAEIEA